MRWSVILLHEVFDMFGDWVASSSPPLPPPLALLPPPAMHKEISLQANLDAHKHMI
jgi:hypothetical protein